MRIGAVIAVVWLIIGLLAAGLRGYFSGSEKTVPTPETRFSPSSPGR